MDDTVVTYVIPAIIGFLSGGIASIIAPWVNWGIEKQRELLKYRRERIKCWRDFIDSIDGWHLDSTFQDTSVYSEMRKYLHEDIRSKIEVQRNTLTLRPREGTGGFAASNKELLLKEIAEIEKNWGII